MSKRITSVLPLRCRRHQNSDGSILPEAGCWLRQTEIDVHYFLDLSSNTGLWVWSLTTISRTRIAFLDQDERSRGRCCSSPCFNLLVGAGSEEILLHYYSPWHPCFMMCPWCTTEIKCSTHPTSFRAPLLVYRKEAFCWFLDINYFFHIYVLSWTFFHE